MSGGPSCKCEERREPLVVADGANRPARLWRVVTRYGNYSAFNGYAFQHSQYSSVCCLRCGSHWRTKSNYVASLPDRTDDERHIAPGYDGYTEAMATLGREPLR